MSQLKNMAQDAAKTPQRVELNLSNREAYLAVNALAALELEKKKELSQLEALPTPPKQRIIQLQQEIAELKSTWQFIQMRM